MSKPPPAIIPSPPSLIPNPLFSLSPSNLKNLTQQLGLQNEFILLVFLRLLIRLVVLPSDARGTLFAANVAHNVFPRGHVSFDGFVAEDVDDGGEEVGFAVLAAEILVVEGILDEGEGRAGGWISKGWGWGWGWGWGRKTSDGIKEDRGVEGEVGAGEREEAGGARDVPY